ncbi:4109_t:CDS:1, partial [Acaulospora colombiana]
MTITGILSIAYLVLYLVTFCYDDDSDGDLNPSPVENACDVILRAGITMAISLPPPASIIHAMKLKIVRRMTANS